MMTRYQAIRLWNLLYDGLAVGVDLDGEPVEQRTELMGFLGGLDAPDPMPLNPSRDHAQRIRAEAATFLRQWAEALEEEAK